MTRVMSLMLGSGSEAKDFLCVILGEGCWVKIVMLSMLRRGMQLEMCMLRVFASAVMRML